MMNQSAFINIGKLLLHLLKTLIKNSLNTRYHVLFITNSRFTSEELDIKFYQLLVCPRQIIDFTNIGNLIIDILRVGVRIKQY